ncbi:MAG: hypothetical protein CBR30_08080 [Dictyoglomus sp. NZ13-RE01]|nr:MAG: hypothetical protein CBR30_08080 [Dictyoglomus sp. NZ13-RE01]
MYFLGVDGGGSKTEAVIIDENLNIYGRGKSGPADVFNSNKETVKNNLISAINSALDSKRIRIEDIRFGGFGLPAVGELREAIEIYSDIIKEILPGRFIIFNDVRGALEGAFPFENGVVLLAGTGIMAMGKVNDEVFRIDGWGEHAGDCGSGYDIGRECLRYIFKMYDGRIEKSYMYELIKEDFEEILRKTKGINSRGYIASYSKIVCESAKNGDKFALKILENAVEEWKLTVSAIRGRIGRNEKIKLAVVGGLKNCKILYDKFLSWVREQDWIVIAEPMYEPSIGCAILAMKNYKGI